MAFTEASQTKRNRMKKEKKPYVSPTVISVKLDATQSILSQCSVGITALENSNPAGVCNTPSCKQKTHGGDPLATS